MLMPHRLSPSGLLLFSVWMAALWAMQTGSSTAAPARSLDGGRLTVTVTNRTTGQPLSGQAITLQRHLGDQPVTELQGLTDHAGRFAFVSLPIDSAHYVATTRYLGVEYQSEPISLQDSVAIRDIRLDVYHTTTRDDQILVEAHHLIIDTKPETLDITEILVFHNNGNETFVSASDSATGAKQGITLSVPPNVIQFQPMTTGIEETAQAPIYTQPIPPGPAQVVYAYSVDRKSMNNVLTSRIVYDTGRVQVLITPSDLAVTSASLTNNGIRRVGGKDYLLLSNPAGLQKGATVEIRFPSTLAWQDLLKWGALGVVVLMVVVGVSAPYFRKQRPPAAAHPTPPRPTRAEREKAHQQHQQLLQAIADLDDQYDAGEIDQAVYQRQRADLKGRAVEALRRIGEDSDA